MSLNEQASSCFEYLDICSLSRIRQQFDAKFNCVRSKRTAWKKKHWRRATADWVVFCVWMYCSYFDPSLRHRNQSYTGQRGHLVILNCSAWNNSFNHNKNTNSTVNIVPQLFLFLQENNYLVKIKNVSSERGKEERSCTEERRLWKLLKFGSSMHCNHSLPFYCGWAKSIPAICVPGRLLTRAASWKIGPPSPHNTWPAQTLHECLLWKLHAHKHKRVRTHTRRGRRGQPLAL